MIRWIALVVAGVAFGALDRAVDLWGSVGSDVANRSSVWLVGAFLAGAALRSRNASAAAGAAFLFAALCGFYGWMHFVEHQADAAYLSSVAAKWSVGALAIGPPLGLLGSAWRRGSRWAPAVAGGLLLLESAFFVRFATLRVETVAVCAAEATVGMLVLVVAFRGRRHSA